MIPKSKTWYKVPLARECPIISCYALKLRGVDEEIYDGYYYCGKFYVGQEDRTGYIKAWMIPQEGESVRVN